MRRRLDVELVRRRLVPSRQEAQRAIVASEVLVGGAVADRPARLVDPSEAVELVRPRPRFVSRGGDKLDAALLRFGVEVSGREALDAGASTGGFTDVLLQRGASRVVSVDVGHGQLHERIRHDPQVEVHERLNIRDAAPATFEGRRFPLIVADLSFISLRTVAVALVGLSEPGADIVVLVKPQFEAGRIAVSRGRGVVTDPEIWMLCLAAVVGAFERAGAAMMALMKSPIAGAEGNVEFLLHVRVGAATTHDPERRFRAAVES